jgi:hypothetical protein
MNGRDTYTLTVTNIVETGYTLTRSTAFWPGASLMITGSIQADVATEGKPLRSLSKRRGR